MTTVQIFVASLLGVTVLLSVVLVVLTRRFNH
jgi:hypothetical protein